MLPDSLYRRLLLTRLLPRRSLQRDAKHKSLRQPSKCLHRQLTRQTSTPTLFGLCEQVASVVS